MSFYFISIGGTGAKVMESLIHLCIAGILPENERLFISAIDPDVGNGNLERTATALNNFAVFQSFSVGNDTNLFKNKVSIVRPFPFNPTGTDKMLDDLINFYHYIHLLLGCILIDNNVLPAILLGPIDVQPLPTFLSF